MHPVQVSGFGPGHRGDRTGDATVQGIAVGVYEDLDHGLRAIGRSEMGAP
jgi:hypothetical protein